MATANDIDLSQNGIINNVHIPSSPSRFVITDEFIYDNQQSCRIGKHPHRPSCREEKDELTAVPAPHIYRALDALIKKVEEQRAHLTPVDSTPKKTELSQQENFKKFKTETRQKKTD
ncbi:hypothetical protein TNCV_1988871 [Trichonephila clavipes]|nr:hypothetical protein TNCV_1988871 [Trichonephila clavipes]